MKHVTAKIATAILVAGLSTPAFAQSLGGQIPSPANPYPANPVATDGSSLAGVRPADRSGFVATFDGGPVQWVEGDVGHRGVRHHHRH